MDFRASWQRLACQPIPFFDFVVFEGKIGHHFYLTFQKFGPATATNTAKTREWSRVSSIQDVFQNRLVVVRYLQDVVFPIQRDGYFAHVFVSRVLTGFPMLEYIPRTAFKQFE